METQLICFIDPFKFSTLISQNLVIKIGFSYSQNDLIGYIDLNGKIEVDKFDLTKARATSILLVPDKFPLEKHYLPLRKFQVLFHGGTDRISRIEPLIRCLEWFEGYEEQPEEEGTIYDLIAQNLETCN